MYKIIIADDEKNTQEGLVNLIDWKQLGFEIVGVFEDGAEVIECLNNLPVDVVFTDIKMKQISGMDVAKYIYDNEIPCKVIFISGYKEFELVLQALRYGVQDYVLKPCKVEEVSSVFRKIKKELDESARNLAFNKKVETRWAEMQPILEEQFLNEFLMGTLSDENDVLQRMQLLYPEIDAEYNPCLIAELKINHYDRFIVDEWNYSTEQFNEAVRNFIMFMDREYVCRVVFRKKGIWNILMLARERQETAEKNCSLCDYMCADFKKQFEEVFRLKITFDSVQYYHSVMDCIHKRKLLAREFVRESDAATSLIEKKKLIMTNLMMGNFGLCQKLLNNILLSQDEMDHKDKKNFVVDIFSNISSFLQENNYGLFMRVQPYLDYHIVLSQEDSKQLVEYVSMAFNVMKSKEGLADQFDKRSLVKRMQEYIDKHIFEDVKLENVANELFISSSQLNRILKKQTGETFLQLVTKSKMEKAMELLHDPQYKVYQVGERLGYKTPRHFSKLFYNFCGYYPIEYRREVLKIGDGVNEER